MARKLLITQPNSAVASQSFDAVGNVRSITNILPGGALSVLTYTYDYSNQRTGESRSDGTVTTWTFDDSLQLTNEWRTNPSASVLGVQTFNSTFAYDPAGNRTLGTDADGTLTTSTYDNANRPLLSVAWTPPSLVVTTTYSSDAVGNRTEVQTPSGNTYTQWDAAGNMTLAEPPAGPVTLSYDAERRRVAKVSTDGSYTRFVFDGMRLLEETAADGTEEITYTTATDDPYGELLSEYDAVPGAEMYHQFDAQGSTDTLSDDSGDVLGPYRYRAFGLATDASMSGWADLTPDLWASAGADDWGEMPVGPASNFGGFGQSGSYLDPETQLFLMGSGGGKARYYDPVPGRFVSEDRIGLAGGDANLFRYCGNDPINTKDPMGTDPLNSTDPGAPSGMPFSSIFFGRPPLTAYDKGPNRLDSLRPPAQPPAPSPPPGPAKPNPALVLGPFLPPPAPPAPPVPDPSLFEIRRAFMARYFPESESGVPAESAYQGGDGTFIGADWRDQLSPAMHRLSDEIAKFEEDERTGHLTVAKARALYIDQLLWRNNGSAWAFLDLAQDVAPDLFMALADVSKNIEPDYIERNLRTDFPLGPLDIRGNQSLPKAEDDPARLGSLDSNGNLPPPPFGTVKRAVTIQELLSDSTLVPGYRGADVVVPQGGALRYDDISQLTINHRALDAKGNPGNVEFMLTRQTRYSSTGQILETKLRIYSGTPDYVLSPPFLKPGSKGEVIVERVIGHTHPRPVPFMPRWNQPSQRDIDYLSSIRSDWKKIYGPNSEPFGLIFGDLGTPAVQYGINSTKGNAAYP